MNKFEHGQSSPERELKPEIKKELVESYITFKQKLNPKSDIIYHPANGMDVSPSKAFPESRIIYVEIEKDNVEALKKAGYEAYLASATEEFNYKGIELKPFIPDQTVDILILLNPAILINVPAQYLREGGYILCNDYHGTATEAMKNSDFELIGIVNTESISKERILDTKEPENYWKIVETDEELKSVDPIKYAEVIELVKEKIGKAENIIEEFKKIIDDFRINKPNDVIEIDEGIFMNGEGNIILNAVLPRKKGNIDDIFVFRKK